MRRRFFVVTLLLVLFDTQARADTVDIGHIVEATGTDVAQTTVVVTRLSDSQTWISNPKRATEQFSPASTSKIPHTLIAIEGGFATVETIFRWDGVIRSSRAWNQDQTLETAFQNSAVWVYQAIAEMAGQDVMARALAEFEYGNRQLGTASHLTTYWLDDTLRISAVEQVEFLSKLALEEYFLSPDTYTIANDIMVMDRSDQWVMRAKTGWRYDEESMDIGWFVGWLECTNEKYVFAMNMDMPDTRYLSRRKQIIYAALEDIGVFDCN